MSEHLLTRDERLARLEAGTAAFADAVVDGHPAAPVPSCPGWTLWDLASHLGGVHRWARGAVIDGHPNTPTPDGPTEQSALVLWYQEAAAALLDTLRSTDPDAACWAFGPPRTVAFWIRRQPLETAVHLWDARAAAGVVPAGLIDAGLAADGVDEVARMLFPRQVRLARMPPLAHRLVLAADDGGWSLALAGDGTGSSDGRDGDAVIRGPAEALLLLLWKRLSVDDARLTVDGDAAAARQVLAAPLTP